MKLKPAPAPGDAVVPSGEDIPTLPELEDPAWFAFGDMWRDLPYDYTTLLENVLDAGGLGWAGLDWAGLGWGQWMVDKMVSMVHAGLWVGGIAEGEVAALEWLQWWWQDHAPRDCAPFVSLCAQVMCLSRTMGPSHAGRSACHLTQTSHLSEF